MSNDVKMLIEYLTGYDEICGFSSSWCAMVVTSQFGGMDPSECDIKVRKVSRYNNIRNKFRSLSHEDQNILFLCFHNSHNKIPAVCRELYKKKIVSEYYADLTPLICYKYDLTFEELRKKQKMSEKYDACSKILDQILNKIEGI